MAHLERGQCTRISSTDIVKLRENKLDFHRDLERLTGETSKGSYAHYMSKIKVHPWANVVEAPSDEHPGAVSQAEYPALGEGDGPEKGPEADPPSGPVLASVHPLVEQVEAMKLVDDKTKSTHSTSDLHPMSLVNKWSKPLVDKTNVAKVPAPAAKSPAPALAAKWQGAWGSNDIQDSIAKARLVPFIDKTNATKDAEPTLVAKWQGAWGTKDVQDSIAKARQEAPRVEPTAEQLASATQSLPKAPVQELDIHDPKHPYFNASKYLCPITGKYVCPKLGCGQVLLHLSTWCHKC